MTESPKGGFDDRAAIEQAVKGVYLSTEDMSLASKDSRLDDIRLCFIKGARWQWQQCQEELQILELKIEREYKFGVYMSNELQRHGEIYLKSLAERDAEIISLREQLAEKDKEIEVFKNIIEKAKARWPEVYVSTLIDVALDKGGKDV